MLSTEHPIIELRRNPNAQKLGFWMFIWAFKPNTTCLHAVYVRTSFFQQCLDEQFTVQKSALLNRLEIEHNYFGIQMFTVLAQPGPSSSEGFCPLRKIGFRWIWV